MPSIISTLGAFALAATLQTASASFAGCYNASSLPLEVSSNSSTIEECSTYCLGQNETYTLSLFFNSENSTSCSCSVESLSTLSLVPALGDSTDPSCPPDTVTASLLDPSYSFVGCSYASSTTAQFSSAVESSHECLNSCSGYPFVYAFPTVSGYNCYCAMSPNSAGPTSCADNTYYAYAKQADSRRSRR